MTILAGFVAIDADGTATKSGLAEYIYDSFVDNYETDHGVPLPGLPELLVPILQGYATLATREAWGHISYLHDRLYTTEQGLTVYLKNATGAASVKGSVVQCSASVDEAFELQDTRLESMGIVYDSGIPNGELCRVVVSGIADVLLEDGQSATRGDWLGAATTNGRAYTDSIPPPISITEHFREIGHCLQAVGPGINVLVRAMVHFL